MTSKRPVDDDATTPAAKRSSLAEDLDRPRDLDVNKIHVTVCKCLPDGSAIEHTVHEAGNLSLYYQARFVPADLRLDLMTAVARTTFLPKVGRAQMQPYPHVGSNLFCWQVDQGHAWSPHAYYPFSSLHHAPLPPLPMYPAVARLRDLAWQWAQQHLSVKDEHRPNAVLINWYPKGETALSPHKDADPFYGDEAVLVLSVSLGAERRIVFKYKGTERVFTQSMASGSLLVMDGADVQRNYTHEVPKGSKRLPARFNFTFRTLQPALFARQFARRESSKPRAELEAMYARCYTIAVQNARRPDGLAPTTATADQLAQGWWTAVDSF